MITSVDPSRLADGMVPWNARGELGEGWLPAPEHRAVAATFYSADTGHVTGEAVLSGEENGDGSMSREIYQLKQQHPFLTHTDLTWIYVIRLDP